MSSIIPSHGTDPNAWLKSIVEQLVLVMLHDATASIRQAAFTALSIERGLAAWTEDILAACMQHGQALLHGLRSSVRPAARSLAFLM
jgi:uncharacterized membrane-anchored protein